jgi:hypothetical protein
MTTTDSTATLPDVRTAPPVNGKDLATVVTGDPATRYDGKNLLITIDVGPDIATFHCAEKEHAGTHKQRHVLFCANEHCWLIFSPKSVFTVAYLELAKGENVPAYVMDGTDQVSTSCSIRVVVPKTSKAAKMMKAVPNAKQGPVIFVP